MPPRPAILRTGRASHLHGARSGRDVKREPDHVALRPATCVHRPTCPPACYAGGRVPSQIYLMYNPPGGLHWVDSLRSSVISVSDLGGGPLNTRICAYLVCIRCVFPYAAIIREIHLRYNVSTRQPPVCPCKYMQIHIKYTYFASGFREFGRRFRYKADTALIRL